MDSKKEYLNEERYKKTKRTISLIAFMVLLAGVIIGSGLIGFGSSIKNSVNVTSVKAEIDAEFKKKGFSEKYYELEAQLEKVSSGKVLCFTGIFVMVVSLFVSGTIFISTKQRELLAYHIQQIRPVAKEGIEKMAPSAGVAAKEIAKGVKEGLKDRK